MRPAEAGRARRPERKMATSIKKEKEPHFWRLNSIIIYIIPFSGPQVAL